MQRDRTQEKKLSRCWLPQAQPGSFHGMLTKPPISMDKACTSPSCNTIENSWVCPASAHFDLAAPAYIHTVHKARTGVHSCRHRLCYGHPSRQGSDGWVAIIVVQANLGAKFPFPLS
jgi:hypothetical protein